MTRQTLNLAGSLLLAIVLFTLGCAKEELDVSYIYLPAFEVLPSATSGDISTQITDVRVVLGSQSLGFYPLPARIPILGGGTQILRLEPVVRIAGISSNRIVYPFYEVFEESLTFMPGTVDTIIPRINYVSTSTFAYVEDFETATPSLVLDLDQNANTSFTRTTTNPSTGTGAGIASLTAGSETVEVATPVLNSRGETWNRIWLEVDFYRNELPITFALLPETPGSEETRLIRYTQGGTGRSADDPDPPRWVKLYFELVDNGLREFARRPFRIGILSAVDTSETNSADVLIDNIKVIYQD